MSNTWIIPIWTTDAISAWYPGKIMPDYIPETGSANVTIEEINDIFAGRGITESIKTHDNRKGMQK